MYFQVAGLPTNINFLQKLANHWAFEIGKVETHFIEHFKDDLFVDPNNLALANEAYDAAKLSAVIIAACVSEKERCSFEESSPGNLLFEQSKIYHIFCVKFFFIFMTADLCSWQKSTLNMVCISTFQSSS